MKIKIISTEYNGFKEVSDYINSIATEGIGPTVEQIKSQAASVFEGLQEDENKRAKEDCDAENARWEAEQAKKNQN